MAHKTRTMVLQQSDEGENRLELPVNPRTVVISRPQNLLRYQTIDGESIQAARGKGLTQVALETFLPGESSRFYLGTAPEEALAFSGVLSPGLSTRLSGAEMVWVCFVTVTVIAHSPSL